MTTKQITRTTQRESRSIPPSTCAMSKKKIRAKCAIVDCPDPVYTDGSMGWCCKHYRRYKRFGDPHKVLRKCGPKMYIRESNPILKFWKRVALTADDSRCWPWLAGTVGDSGYGAVQWNGVNRRSHTVAFEITNGYQSPLHILHRCNNAICVNPQHLYEGTDQDNSHDRVIAGTQPRGERTGTSKMTAEKVLQIRAQREAGVSSRDLATQFNLHIRTIRNIVNRDTWRHI